MIITYDKDADAMYINLNPDKKPYHTDDVQADVILDYDKHGAIIGIEILHAPEKIIDLHSKEGEEYINKIVGGENIKL